MASYEVRDTLMRHNGNRYRRGETVEMDPAQAEWYVRLGGVRPAGGESGEAERPAQPGTEPSQEPEPERQEEHEPQPEGGEPEPSATTGKTGKGGKTGKAAG